MGGLSNWSKIESIRLSGSVERNGQIGSLVIIKKRPNKVRATITLPIPGKPDEFLQIIQAHDGKDAWSATRLAGTESLNKKELKAEAAQTLLADADVMPKLIVLWRTGAELKLEDPVLVGGQPTYVIRAQAKKSDNNYIFYLSQDDFRTIQYEEQIGTDTTLTRIEKYAEKNGVWLPTHLIVEAAATGKTVMTTNSILLGVGIYNEYFKIGKGSRRAEL